MGNRISVHNEKTPLLYASAPVGYDPPSYFDIYPTTPTAPEEPELEQIAGFITYDDWCDHHPYHKIDSGAFQHSIYNFSFRYNKKIDFKEYI